MNKHFYHDFIINFKSMKVFTTIDEECISPNFWFYI